MLSSGSERRQFSRADYVAKIKITRKGTNEDTFSFTKNIGTGGICATMNKDLGVFSEVTIEINLKEGIFDPIICEGKVVWVIKKAQKDKFGQDSYDTGIEFDNISRESQEQIEKVVQTWRSQRESLG